MNKRRAGRAPEGSGVPVGAEYHWYIVAHQKVAKQNANDYTTSLTGLKFEVAHKRAGTGKWSATPRTQRKRIAAFLRRLIADIEKSTGTDEALAASRRAADREGQSRRPRFPARRSARGKPSRTVRRARMSAG